MNRSLEITGKYQGERYRSVNDDGSVFLIGTIRLANGSKSLAQDAGVDSDAPLSIKGVSVDELEQGQTYRFFGNWGFYNNRRTGRKEKQFNFQTIVPHIPQDKEGVIDYLAAAGTGNGIGVRKAEKIVEAFGADHAIEAMRERPEEISNQFGIRLDQAEKIAAKLKEQQATEVATLEVDRLLKSGGFPKSLTNRVIKRWKNEAAERITSDPYSLMEFSGVGFAKADKLYISIGKDPAAIDRQAMCLWYSMSSDNNGHTWFPARDVVAELQNKIGGDRVDYRSAIIRGKELAEIQSHGAIATTRTGFDDAIDDSGDSLWLAESKNARDEVYVASRIAKFLNFSPVELMTKFGMTEFTSEEILKTATCQRCGRQLTASEVHIADGRPYGPTCIQFITATSVGVQSLQDWLEQNPQVVRWVKSIPSGVIKLPIVSLWPEPDALHEKITDHQRHEYAKATASRIGILSGSPGTGKTTTLAAIIKAAHQSGQVGYHEIGVAAPTGKAAVRLTESLKNAGVPIQARTVHSMLGVGAADTETGHWMFKYGEHKPWPFKMMFFDEQSMTDIGMMRCIFAAIPVGCHVLFVGDVNQLPPVGNGAPFRDMLRSKIPCGELRDIMRNSGGIVESCAAIRDELPWVNQPEGSNLIITGDRDAAKQKDRLFRELRSVAESGHDPVWDCQVLVPTNKLRQELNKAIQAEFNDSPEVEGTPFREGDKVVCLANGFFESHDDEEAEEYVANGEIGCVTLVEEKHLLVKLDEDRTIRVPRGKRFKNEDGTETTGCKWDLGYALTVHKFQGSEQRFVFVMLDEHARRTCDRSWIYTAISRAKERCVLIGTQDFAKRVCREQRINRRRTFLSNLIAMETVAGEMESL